MEAHEHMTEVTKPEKFLFTLSFDDEVNEAGKEKEPTYSQEQYDAARKESYDAGFAAGQKAAQEEEAKHIGVLLEDVGRKLEHVTKTSSDVWEEQLRELQQTSLVIMRKILPSYIEEHGQEEIVALVERVINEMAHEPRLVFRVAPDHFKEMEDKIRELTTSHAFAGDVVIIEDKSLAHADCRIEWSNGGIERDLKALWRGLDQVMEKNLGLEEGALTEEALAPSEEELQAQESRLEEGPEEQVEAAEETSSQEEEQQQEPVEEAEPQKLQAQEEEEQETQDVEEQEISSVEENVSEEKLDMQMPETESQEDEDKVSADVTLEEESQTGDEHE